MYAPVFRLDPKSLLIDASEARRIGQDLAPDYQSKSPFPHGCYDNFLEPIILDRILDDLTDLPAPEANFNRAQEKLKFSYSPDKLPQYTRQVFFALNSKPFIAFLEGLTGIKGLIPDPYYLGAGIHSVRNGGHLDIHADFNHHKIMNLERRINVLIYLNKEWRADFGGSFEIWNGDMSERVESFTPIFNRMCCFNTTSSSWHGNPEPVNHPSGSPRQSIALYYYTSTWTDLKRGHTTRFVPRPNSTDKRDHLIARKQFIKDMLPPVIYRRIAGKLGRLGL